MEVGMSGRCRQGVWPARSLSIDETFQDPPIQVEGVDRNTLRDELSYSRDMGP
jgi:hypothetical protein